MNFNIASSATCDGSVLTFNNVQATCASGCEGGDNVSVTGYVTSSTAFDDATVTLKPCITGPFNSVCLYHLDEITVGTACDWITSDTVSCGTAADDYYLFKSIEIPEEMPKYLSWITGFKVKAFVGDLAECDATSSSEYQMVAAVMLFAGAAALVRRRHLRLNAMEDKKVSLLELPGASSPVVKGVEEEVTV